jgi:hypothetical protein
MFAPVTKVFEQSFAVKEIFTWASYLFYMLDHYQNYFVSLLNPLKPRLSSLSLPLLFLSSSINVRSQRVVWKIFKNLFGGRNFLSFFLFHLASPPQLGSC